MSQIYPDQIYLSPKGSNWLSVLSCNALLGTSLPAPAKPDAASCAAAKASLLYCLVKAINCHARRLLYGPPDVCFNVDTTNGFATLVPTATTASWGSEP